MSPPPPPVPSLLIDSLEWKHSDSCRNGSHLEACWEASWAAACTCSCTCSKSAAALVPRRNRRTDAGLTWRHGAGNVSIFIQTAELRPHPGLLPACRGQRHDGAHFYLSARRQTSTSQTSQQSRLSSCSGLAFLSVYQLVWVFSLSGCVWRKKKSENVERHSWNTTEE